MIHPSILLHLPYIHEACERNHITRAYLFGSVLCDTFHADSDLDLLVSLQEGLDPVKAGESLWNFIEEVENLTGRQVDLHTERNLRNPYFIEEVNKTKCLIYGQ